MRVIRRYRFEIGTKIPFVQWPEIVHRFLVENGLTYQRFLYHFTDNVFEPQACPKACERLQKDCPEIGESHILPTAVSGMSKYVLTNISGERDFQEALLLPLMGKIHRSYGFAEVMLGYYDVPFFGRVIPFEVADDPRKSSAWYLHGSAISLYRDAVFGTAELVMTIDVLQDGQLLEAAPYCEAMRKLLPKVRVTASMEIVLTKEEKQRIAQTNQAAEPVLERCRIFFSQRLSAGLNQNLTGPSYSLATALKKLAKKYGYTYSKESGSGTTCILQTRTARGNVLHVWVDAGPSHTRTEVCVSFKGVGFSHCLASADYAPANQEELEEALAQTMAFVEEFRSSLLMELDACFPPCPEWFEPDGW